MKKIFLLLAFGVAIGAKAQRPDSVVQFIDSALALMQQHSMYANRVNWTEVKDSVGFLSKEATTYGETAPALHYAFLKLGDKHGFLLIEGKDYRYTEPTKTATRINANMAMAASKGARVYVSTFGNYAYLSIPYFNDQSLQGANAFAQRLQDSLCSVMTTKTKGIILDLRLNAGGFTQAMLIGISNVFGNQKPANTKPYTGDWVIENYGTAINDTFRIQLKAACGDFTRLPVAVLIGPQTASAGEYLALGFALRNKTILVGEHTAGYTSGNNGFRLPGNKNGIVLAEDYAVDKSGKMYTDGIDPNILVPSGDDFFNPGKDKKVAAAVKWLAAQSN